MEFKFKNLNNVIQKLNLAVGQKFNNQNFSNQYLNTIFNVVDTNKDGVLQENEYIQLDKLLEYADSIESKDKVLSDKELSTLVGKIKNNNINYSDFKLETMTKVNPAEYKLNSLKRRYPETIYNYKVKEFRGKLDELEITYKKTNKPILHVYYDSKGFYVTEYKNNGKEGNFYNYSADGVLNFYDDNYNNQGRKYPIIELLYKDITSKNKFGLPTTGKNIAKHISYIDKNNIITLTEEYKSKYGEDLIDAINGEIGLDKNVKYKLIHHLQRCYEDYYGYKRSFKNDNSQVKSKWHNGDIYSVENKNDVLTITNKKNGKKVLLNLEKLVKNLDLRAKGAVKAQVSKLPGEVLMDLAIEVDSFKTPNFFDKKIRKNTAAYYMPATDNITLGVSQGFDISSSLVHELGHAVDYTGNMLSRNKSTSEKYAKFKNAFEEELKAYISQGGVVYDDSKTNDFMANTYIKENGGDNISVYATNNNHECFAECYKLLTTGTCRSANVLEDFFPKTIRAAEEMLKYIRSLDDSVRH